MGNFLRLSLIALVISVTASCGGGGGDGKKKTSPTTECPVDDPYCNSDYAELKIKTPDNRIWLSLSNEYNTLLATPQGRLRNTTEFTNINAKNLEFWSSSDESIATVDQDGLITAVSIGETDITYELEIFNGIRQPVTIRIIVKETSANTPPIAIAGDDFTIYSGSKVQLDGTASYDLDGEIIDWYWAVKNGSLQGEKITGNKTSTPSFFAPNSKQKQQILLELTVRDNNDESHTDSIAITILPSSTQNPPTVTMEKPSDIIEGQSATLIGSFDDINETAKSCEWSWSDNVDGSNSQLITGIIEPCPQILPVLTFTPDLQSVPSDVYVTLLVTDWLNQTAKVTQKFTVTEKTIETVMYKVTTAAGKGGTISPVEQDVIENNRQEFILDPDNGNGYIIDLESVNSTCGGELEGNIFLTDPITEPCRVSANFKLNSYEVSASAIGTGGTISLITSNPILHGDYAEIEITPTEGYQLKSFSGTCGEMVQSQDSANRYISKDPIKVKCNIKAEFQKKKYTITSGTNGEGGKLSPKEIVLEHGSDTSISIIPDDGYILDDITLEDIKGCNGIISEDKTAFLVSNIQTNCQITASFIPEPPIQISIEKVGTGNGTVSSDIGNIICGDICDEEYTRNSTVLLSAIPDDNSIFVDWSDNCEIISDNCLISIDQVQNITATFDIKPPAITNITSGVEQISIEWTPISTATGYWIYLSKASNIDPNNPFSYISKIYSSNSQSQATITALDIDTTYSVAITSIPPKLHESAISNEVQGRPYATPLADRYVPIDFDGTTNSKGAYIRDIVTHLEWKRCTEGQTWNVEEETCEGYGLSSTWEDATQINDNGFVLPSVQELRTLLYCSTSEGTDSDNNSYELSISNPYDHGVSCAGEHTTLTIQQDAFPNNSRTYWGYWTSTSYIPDTSWTWAIDFLNGYVGRVKKDGNTYYKLVRRPSSLIANRYLPFSESGQVTSSGSIIRDIVTNLEWKRCSEGQTWEPLSKTCSGEAQSYSLETASLLFSSGNFTIPSINQLRSLIYCSNGTIIEKDPENDEILTQYDTMFGNYFNSMECGGSSPLKPTIQPEAFPQTPNFIYWSNTPHINEPNEFWTTHLDYGVVIPIEDLGVGTEIFHIRLIKK